MEKEPQEYVYEFGLTNDDKERIQHLLGVHCLSLEDYANAQDIINSIEEGKDEINN